MQTENIFQRTLDPFFIKQQKIVDPNATSFTCDWCGLTKSKMTIWRHISGITICLCFIGCHNFPEPFRKAIPAGSFQDWERIDRFQLYHKKMNYGINKDIDT